MRALLVVAALVAAGCSRVPGPNVELATECFVQAAYDAYRAEVLAAAPEPVDKCCGQCGKNGLPKGKVLSGDKQKIVPCPCPDSCSCKCASGVCRP